MIYVTSDIHGNRRRFDSILEQINLKKNDTLYILGDVVDRHPDGINILLQIMKTPNIKMLLGNHEYMMLKALESPYPLTPLLLWFRNGGEVTLDHLNLLSEKEKDEIVSFLKSLPLYYEVKIRKKRYKLIHASIEENFTHSSDFANKTEYALFERVYPTDDLPSGFIYVIGHTPVCYFTGKRDMKIMVGEDRIYIDCGSGFPEKSDPNYSRYPGEGKLACLRLNDMKEFYSDE